MARFAAALYAIVVTAWVGGLLAIGYLAAPMLFAQVADRALAAQVAGALFAAMAVAGLVCGAYLLLYVLLNQGWRSVKTAVFWLILGMLAIAALGHFGIHPLLAQLKAEALPQQVMQSPLRDRFALWHGISVGLYVIQTLLGLWLVVIHQRARR